MAECREPEPGDALLFFARFPEPGRVKTRLIPRLGPSGAAEVYRRVAEMAAREARSLHSGFRRPGLTLAAFADPPERAPEVGHWLGPAFIAVPQSEGDLGRRLAAGFSWAFGRGARRVVAMGADCPELTAPILAQAFDDLLVNDAVLGPALDGGYYLIGLSRWLPEAFEGIPWSTGKVLEATLARLGALEASYRLLAPLRDLDTPQDLEALLLRFPELLG